jgi:hypothetical protein
MSFLFNFNVILILIYILDETFLNGNLFKTSFSFSWSLHRTCLGGWHMYRKPLRISLAPDVEGLLVKEPSK